MTGVDIITIRVRPLLNDRATEPAQQTWLDDDLIPLLNDAVNMIVSLRPDCLLASDGATIITVVPIVDIGDTFSLADVWAIAVVSYIMGQALKMPGKAGASIQAAEVFDKQFAELIKVL